MLHGVHRKSDTIGQVNNNDFVYFGQGAKSGIARHTSMFFKKVPNFKKKASTKLFSPDSSIRKFQSLHILDSLFNFGHYNICVLTGILPYGFTLC